MCECMPLLLPDSAINFCVVSGGCTLNASLYFLSTYLNRKYKYSAILMMKSLVIIGLKRKCISRTEMEY